MSSHCALRMPAWLIAAALLINVGNALGQIVTPAAGTIEWTNPAGWSTGHVPGGTETPQISTGTVTVTGAASVASLNFFGGAISNPVNGSSTLTLTGRGSD